MNFIFPQNYDFKYKLFGIIDYVSAIINLIWGGIIYILINIFFKSIQIKIFIFIIFVLPFLIISIVGINGENILSVCIYIIKFLIKPKLMIFNKK